MDFQVPLNKLKFGQDDGAGINARVAGRLDGIEALAANLYAVGQIENLVVKRCDGDFFSVSNGNRRLAAFRQIHGDDSDALINCTLRDVDEAQAFEDSLITAVTAKQLHPVDQYEAFARLEENGKNNEEIARLYGMSEKEVRQALALGRQLSPMIRDAWRLGVIKADVAQAFTLGRDHKTQDKLFKKLEKAGPLYDYLVRREFGAGVGDSVAGMLAFVGADAYRARGGNVVEDLFRSGSIVSDGALLKTMLAEALEAKCEELRTEGWSWVAQLTELGQAARYWIQIPVKKSIYEGDEEQRLAQMETKLGAAEHGDDNLATEDLDHDEAVHQLEVAIADLKLQVRRRSITEAQRKRTGCIVEFDEDEGIVTLKVGVDRPEAVVEAPAKPKADKAAAGESAAVPEEPAISQALLTRLSLQLTEGAATALSQDVSLALVVLLAGFASKYNHLVKISVNGLGGPVLDLTGGQDLRDNIAMLKSLSLQDRMALVAPIAAAGLDFHDRTFDRNADEISAVCDVIEPAALNAALRGAFDAKDYFGSVNKALCLQAITDVLGDDVARQQSKSSKVDIAAFALENVPSTGWLPIQLRAKGYDGPPVAKVAPARIEAEVPAPMKKAAAAKKVAKKTLAKPAPKKAVKPAAKKPSKPAGKKPAKKATSKKKKA